MTRTCHAPAMNDATTPQSPTERWRIVLLEDDERLRGFFEQSIRQHPALDLQASFGLLRQAQAWLEDNPADLLLTDLALPDGHGLELIYRLRKLQPACDTLVISVLGDEDTVLACVEAGAVGYIHKDTQPDDMGRIIVDVKRGASPISPMLARKLLERLRQAEASEQAAVTQSPGSGASPSVHLTGRESDVLRLIARGYSYAEIADMEGISKHTVQMHIKNLYGKLAVHSRGQAVYQASLLGLVNPPGL
jgi:DNA-binding NarL/FixJ family response regulator